MKRERRRWLEDRYVELRHGWSDVRLLFKRTFQEFVDDHCADIAAGISYYVMFSIFPMVLLAISIAGMVLTDEALRGEVVRRILAALPLVPGAGRTELGAIFEGLVDGSAVSGIAGILGLSWSASAMMGALRYAIGQAWDAPERRPFLRGKLVDLLMLGGLGGLLTLSVGSTVAIQVGREVSERAASWLGPLGSGARLGFELVATLVPLSLSFATFLLIYRVIPSVQTRVRDIWPGALFASVLFEVAKTAFAVYLRYFGHYDRIYGSLGAIVAFLFFVYIGANVLLLGAEMASEWPRVLHGVYDRDDAEGAASAGGTPLRGRVASALRGLVHDATPTRHPELDPEARLARRRRPAQALARSRAAEEERVATGTARRGTAEPARGESRAPEQRDGGIPNDKVVDGDLPVPDSAPPLP